LSLFGANNVPYDRFSSAGDCHKVIFSHLARLADRFRFIGSWRRLERLLDSIGTLWRAHIGSARGKRCCKLRVAITRGERINMDCKRTDYREEK
jgi:hypothetical protein